MARQRFTLVELCIVVAIVAILAAIAIPAFFDMQVKARRAEIPTNVEGLFTSVVAFDAGRVDAAAVDAGSWCPRAKATVNKVAVPWVSGCGTFSAVSWSPDGDVRGTYYFQAQVTPGDQVASAYCDIDGDGASVAYNHLNRNAVPVTVGWSGPGY